jgi:hypothetical protein
MGEEADGVLVADLVLVQEENVFAQIVIIVKSIKEETPAI